MADLKLSKVKFKITYTGDFDLKHLYNMIYDWLRANDWKSMKGDDDADQCEILYRQNDLAGGLQEHHIWWRLKKEPKDGPEYKYDLNINFQTVALQKKEIVYKGKKIQADSGEVGIEITCNLIFNPAEEGKWDTGIMKRFYSFYIDLKKKQIDAAWDNMYMELYYLQAHIKQYLNLRQFIPAPEVELFHPSKEYSH